MTSIQVASVDSSSKTQFIEEASLIIAAQNLSPSMMSLDFLRFSGIIPQDWELAQQPVLNQSFAQLNFTNGVNFNAQPNTITLNESLRNKTAEQISISQVADKYITKLPQAEYMGLSFSPKILLPFPNDPQAVQQYITGSLLGSGAWKRIGTVPLQAGINLMYYLERCQLTVSISEAKLQKSDEETIAAVLFSSNFNYNVNLGAGQSQNRIAQMSQFLSNWQTDLEEFRNIVNQKFLDSTPGDSTQIIGATSLFPGQML